MPLPSVVNEPHQAVCALIDTVENPKLREALKLVWSKRGEIEVHPNEAHWPIEETSGGHNACLMIGIVQWWTPSKE